MSLFGWKFIIGAFLLGGWLVYSIFISHNLWYSKATYVCSSKLVSTPVQHWYVKHRWGPIVWRDNDADLQCPNNERHSLDK